MGSITIWPLAQPLLHRTVWANDGGQWPPLVGKVSGAGPWPPPGWARQGTLSQYQKSHLDHGFWYSICQTQSIFKNAETAMLSRLGRQISYHKNTKRNVVEHWTTNWSSVRLLATCLACPNAYVIIEPPLCHKSGIELSWWSVDLAAITLWLMSLNQT